MMKRLVVAVMALSVSVLAALPAHASGAYAGTEVLHGGTFTEFSPADICGDRANWTTYELQAEVAHLTERGDGSFVFHFTETGTYQVDFVDPTIPDQESQFTGTQTIAMTPGETFVNSYTWHDFPTGITIHERYHLTEVDGVPVVDRYILDVTGCPAS